MHDRIPAAAAFSSHTLGIALCIIVAIFVSQGCSGGTEHREDDATRDFNFIGRAYGLILQRTRRAPKDVAEIKETLGALHAAGVSPAPEEVLVSSRDGQPYVIVLKGPKPGQDESSAIMAYEKIGAEGKRYVLMTSLDVAQLSDEDFKQAKFMHGHKPDLP